ncbi:YfgM family protein [Lonepinella sp. BR2271]|uniref:YfgM family protein n=1 Tax=Lonepinella sp. BR2271 TaxID=3434550 RepID=UPI003F6DBF9E
MAYSSLEEQELNEIKSWWKENYKSLIAAVIIGAGGVFGWRFWQDYQASKAQQMSAQYEQAVYSNVDATTKNTQIDAFVKEHSKTGYATLALLEKAKSAVQNQDFSQAEVALKDAMAQAPDEILSSIAGIRLAEIQLQQDKFDEVLSTLNLVKDATWESRKNLLTAKVQLAKGDNATAKQTLESVLKNGSALEQQEVKVLLNNL